MKKALLALTLVFVALLSNAQTKVGYINTNELVALMPQTDSVKTKLEAIRNQWMAELQQMNSTYQTKVTEYKQLEAAGGTLPARLEIRRQEIAELEQKINQTQQYAQQDLAQQEQALFQPVIDMVLAAIEKVAKAKGYDFVLDAADGYNVLYSNPEHNLMMAVRAELKIPVDAKPIDLGETVPNAAGAGAGQY
ncbi:OmpH family outer membrane protein [bacterium]|nr:OmpH family outer membrane protein [bacterium]